jgi:hypothetical protein
LILRNGGNDWDKTMFRDCFMQALMKGSFVDVQDYVPSIVFLNGEYWGIHNVSQRRDENYLEDKYRISKDSIIILEQGGEVFYGKKSDNYDFIHLLNFVKNNDLSLSKNYDFIASRIDLNSLIDLIIANVYFCNSDWPNNNVRFWRSIPGSVLKNNQGIRDGKWRWILYDTDWGFGYTGEGSVNLNLLDKLKISKGSMGALFYAFIRNDIFLKTFIQRFNYHLDYVFEPKRVINLIDKFEKQYEGEISEHIYRWLKPSTYNHWKSNVEDLREFANSRPLIQKKQLKQFLEQNRIN